MRPRPPTTPRTASASVMRSTRSWCRRRCLRSLRRRSIPSRRSGGSSTTARSTCRRALWLSTACVSGSLACRRTAGARFSAPTTGSRSWLEQRSLLWGSLLPWRSDPSSCRSKLSSPSHTRSGSRSDSQRSRTSTRRLPGRRSLGSAPLVRCSGLLRLSRSRSASG
eukprot:Amastigsp_a509600_5.p3 type:complete len:166 gc:universal Amastigsp_a509600_5:345-842(+)